ncbi:thioredoxin family protein [Halopenitus sp. H-Gu1]|uniref:thioredoxin family protein n=1 Tax=Halopenitus sp. H-Gu1 TaxID=3242697 RepID=UPI00359D5F01
MTTNPPGGADPGAGLEDGDPSKPVGLDSEEELNAFLADHDVALVEFYTEGCTICQSVEPVLGTVAKGAEIAIATINPRNDADLIEDYQIKSVPTLVLFLDGEPVDRLAEGFVGVDRVLEFIATHAPDRVPENQ